MLILSVSLFIGILAKMGGGHCRRKSTNDGEPPLQGFPITMNGQSWPYQTNPCHRSLGAYMGTCCSECCCPRHILLNTTSQC